MTRSDLQAPPESLASREPAGPPAPHQSASPPAPLQPASLRAAPTLPAPPTPDAAGESELRIAWLEGRVAALEAALERRSEELRLLQRHLCPLDLAQLARLAAGLPLLPRIACEPGFWRETRELTEADVPETLEALWSSLHPPRPDGPPSGSMPPEAPGTPGPAGTPPPRGTAAP